jgi:hypothetical protein
VLVVHPPPARIILVVPVLIRVIVVV